MAFTTPSGPATLRLAVAYPPDCPPANPAVEVQAWGPGAADAAASAPRMLGRDDDWSAFDEPAFHANGKRFAFDLSLGNVRTPIPIHGFLQYTDQWQIGAVFADDRSARGTSRPECFPEPVWMKALPFPPTSTLLSALPAPGKRPLPVCPQSCRMCPAIAK